MTRKAWEPSFVAGLVLLFAIHLPSATLAQDETDWVTRFPRDPVHVYRASWANYDWMENPNGAEHAARNGQKITLLAGAEDKRVRLRQGQSAQNTTSIGSHL